MGLWSDIVRRGTTGEYRKEIITIESLVSVLEYDGFLGHIKQTGVCVRMKSDKFIYMLYPMNPSNHVPLSNTSINKDIVEDVTIRPATKQEAREWKTASGLGRSWRRSMKTYDDLMRCPHMWTNCEIITKI